MGGSGLISLIVFGVVVAYPMWRILPRVGISPWWALAVFVPFGLIVLLWLVAFRDWTSE